jgi:hypothetical protein
MLHHPPTCQVHVSLPTDRERFKMTRIGLHNAPRHPYCLQGDVTRVMAESSGPWQQFKAPCQTVACAVATA